MKKIAIMLIVLMVIGIGFLSGCEEKTSGGNSNVNTHINGDTNLVEVIDNGMRLDTTKSYYDFWEVTGTIKNIAGRKLNTIKIIVSFYDNNGNFLDSKTDYIYNLANSYTEDFSVRYDAYEKYYENVDNYKIRVDAS